MPPARPGVMHNEASTVTVLSFPAAKLDDVVLPLTRQERLPEGNQNHVPSERPQHHPAAMRVRVLRPVVHGDWVHGEWRPQHVPFAARDREHADTRQQHPLRQVDMSHFITLCLCGFPWRHSPFFLHPPQSVWPPSHGGADLIRDEIPGVSELCAPRPGNQKLPAGPTPHHQDRRFRDEPEPVQQRLLPHPGPGSAPHSVDGLGEHPAGELHNKTLLSKVPQMNIWTSWIFLPTRVSLPQPATCGRLVSPCGRSSPCVRSSPTVCCLTNRSSRTLASSSGTRADRWGHSDSRS